jgi:two-component system, response regulator YesN
MYKVLLVDDEPMALEGLKYVVDWKKLGFSICGNCFNGKEAIEFIDKDEPDVIITDIKMPFMDGLDLIRYAKEQGKDNIKFIVVSGYCEFEYAKKAMQYDVRFYFQKPILQEEIYEIIVEAKKQLEETCRHRECSKMDQKALLEGVLNNILWGSDSKSAYEYLKTFWDEDSLLMDWNCIVVELEAPNGLDIKGEFKNTSLEVKKVINEAIYDSSDTFILEQGSNTFIILVSLKKEESQKGKINFMAEKLYQSIDSVILSGFTIGIGENVVGINAVKHSYTTAVASLAYRFYKGLRCMVFYNEIKEKTFNFQFNEFFMSNKVIEAVEELDNNKIKNIIDTTFEYFRNHSIDPNIVKMFTSNMICKISNLTYQPKNKANRFIDNHTIREFKDHERTMEELKTYFQGLCIGYCDYLKKMRCDNSENNISRIDEFIKKNYKRNITIQELAESVYLHPAYLGQLFVRKFGIGFNEYVHEMRIEEAKRLMKITNLKNHEIAEGLGYCNYNSFLHQFLKSTGMKPTEFRNSKLTIKTADENSLV